MRRLQLVFAAFVLILMQMTLAPRLALGPVEPDFVLLLVIYIAVNRTTIQGSVIGWVVGFVQDLFNPELLGLNALTKAIVGYGVGTVRRKADTQNPLFLFVMIALTAAAHDFIYLMFFTGLEIWRMLVMWVTDALPSALYTAVAGVVLHWLVVLANARVVRGIGKARL